MYISSSIPCTKYHICFVGFVQAFKNIEETWLRALNVLQNCDCKFGCPVCTQVFYSKPYYFPVAYRKVNTCLVYCFCLMSSLWICIVISGYAKLISECNNAFNYWLPGCQLMSLDKLLGTFLWQQSAHETVTNEADSSKHASITLLESLLCTRQISSIPAPDNRFGVPMEMEAVKTKSHALSPKSDSKLVNKVANQYFKSTTSVGYKKGPYVSSKTSRKCIGPTPSSIVGVGGAAVIDLS